VPAATAADVAVGALDTLEEERCYRAVLSRDERFDGWFVTAVVTTRIYCRPSCPAMTPKRHNMRYYATPAAAQQHGFRACKRCRPDASPGSPQWNIREDVVARAMRLIADGVVDREGVGGLARRLGYSERHLTRVVSEELGAGPLAIARAQRAHTARLLIESTELPFTDIAHGAGFGSVRQFNDTVREVFAVAPSELRRLRRAAPAAAAALAAPGEVSVRLPARAPFDALAIMRFLAMRCVPGVEAMVDGTYHRTLRLPHGHGTVALQPERDGVRAIVRVVDWRDVAPAVQRCRRLLDLDADPVAIDDVLGADPVLAQLVAGSPGRRSPGHVDGAELAVRAVLGQQVSVAGARTVTGRIVAVAGERLTLDDPHLTHLFPAPAALAALGPEHLPMPDSRRRTLRAMCAAIDRGDIAIDPGTDRTDLVDRLRAVPGIGPWTASYVVMRGLNYPDSFLPTDVGVRNALVGMNVDASPRAAAALAERWRPFRSYALHHLWASLDPTTPRRTREQSGPSGGRSAPENGGTARHEP
jgi:AraC family transcriptional regulator of adaptative response / DNA-3-methyladenine glycosylase II